jgi:hypothetical protein
MIQNTPSRRGVLYIALGKESLREAVLSARSLHRFHCDLPVQIFTDRTVMPGSWRKEFSFVEALAPGAYLVEDKAVLARVLRVRVNCLGRTRFRETLHLDADTKVLKPIDEIWTRLEEADFAIANEPLNDWPANPDVLLEYKNPRYYNAGVFAFRDTPAWRQFLAEWCRRLELIPDHELVHATGGDQRPLNAMIFDEGFAAEIGLRIAELDNLKFNARGIMFKRLRREKRMSQVCIAHCHSVHAPLTEVARLKWLTLLRRIGIAKS